MRTLVCGGRRDVKAARIFYVMGVIAFIIRGATGQHVEIGEGGAQGTDHAAGDWADRFNYSHWHCPINNDLDGHDPMTAPKRRNQRMLDTFKPELCVGFPGHGGTSDMMARCQRAGVPVWDVEFNDTGFAIVLWRRGQHSLLIYEGKFNEPVTSITVDRDHLGLLATL